MRRRANLKIVDSKEEANFLWTQNCDWEQSCKGSIFVDSAKTERESSTIYSENSSNSTSNLLT